MPAYLPMGWRVQPALADATGLNPGGITAAFDTGVLDLNVPVVEMYHFAVTGIIQLTVCKILVRQQPIGYFAPGGGVSSVTAFEADYSSGIPVKPGDELDFLFSGPSISSGFPNLVNVNCDEFTSTFLANFGSPCTGSGGAAPLVTAWFRYDALHPWNKEVR